MMAFSGCSVGKGRVTSQLRKEEGRGMVCSFSCQLLLVLSLRSGKLLKRQGLGPFFGRETDGIDGVEVLT